MTLAAAPALTAELPPFIRRAFGMRSPRRFHYDALTRVRTGEAVFLLGHPEDVRHILVVNPGNYIKTRKLTGAAGRRRAGEGLLTSTGAAHLRQRHLLRPLFRRDAVAALEGAIEAAVERTLARWDGGLRFDLAAEMADLARTVILAALFGPGLDSREEEALARAIAARRRFTELVYYGRLAWRERLPSPVVRAHRRAFGVIDGAVAEAIARRRANGPGDDLIGQLMEASYADGSTMSDRQVRDEVLTLMSTGYETLGEALTWLWYLLDRHPDVEANLAAELAAVVGERPARADDVARLPFLDQVLSETLRLYPPTWLYARVPLKADVLPVGGPVPAGATLYICQYLLHRHPRHWPDPERFVPERFVPGVRPARFVYLPFGDGRHRCLGEHLARLEAMLVVAHVARGVRVRVIDPGPVEPRGGVTLSPRHRLWARAEPRSAA